MANSYFLLLAVLSTVFAFMPTGVSLSQKSLWFPGFSKNAAIKRVNLMTNAVDGTAISGSLKPTENNVLVRTEVAERKTLGGILLPEALKKFPADGVVAEAGPGVVNQRSGLLHKVSVKEGEHVVYRDNHAYPVKYNDHDHAIVKDHDIMMKYTADAKGIANSSEPTPAELRCIGDYMLVKLSSNTSPSSTIAVVNNDKNKLDEGVVVQVGPGRETDMLKRIPVDVCVGDVVRFKEYSAIPMTLQKEAYAIIRFSDVLVKWKS